MNTYLLFGLLASLAVNAAPAKRHCNRKSSVTSSVTDDSASSIRATNSASAQATSLAAVAAWGQGQGDHRSGRGSRTASHTASTAVTPSSVIDTTSSSVADDEPSAETSTRLTSAVVQPTTSSAPAPTASTPSTGGGTITGRGAGLAINDQSVKSFSGFLQGNLGWYTGWATTPLKGTDGLEWVPQVWGTENVADVKAKAASWPSSVKSVLSFNEPDMSRSVGGSAIDAGVAATKHIEWVANLGGDYSIGSPAVARGSTKWMDDWVAACDGKCKYDFVAFHFYGTSADDLISYAKEFHAKYNKPLWITEWSCIDYSNGHVCNADEVKTFMKTAIDWFQSSGIVERWAYFGAFPEMASSGNSNGLENPDGSPNAMGKYYISL